MRQKRKHLLLGCILILFASGLSGFGCRSEPCSWQVMVDGSYSLSCEGVRYEVEHGKDGNAGGEGALGEKGAQGENGEEGQKNCFFVPSQTDPRTGVLRCKGVGEKEYSNEWIVLNGNAFSFQDHCFFQQKYSSSDACHVLEIVCKVKGQDERFLLGGRSCHRFEAQELKEDGEPQGNPSRSGTLSRSGEPLLLEKAYRFRLVHEGLTQELQLPGFKTFSRTDCRRDLECRDSYCEDLKLYGDVVKEIDQKKQAGAFGAYDIECQGAAPPNCMGVHELCVQVSSVLGRKVCYTRTGEEKGCFRNEDCVFFAEDAERTFCNLTDNRCYRRKINEKAYDECRMRRSGYLGECVLYPFRHYQPSKPGRCVLFRLSGRLEEVPRGKTPQGQKIFERGIPGKSFCNWLKAFQTHTLPGQEARTRIAWDSFDRGPQGMGPHEFSGFVDFVDGTRSYFRFPLFADIDSFWNQCACPPDTVFDFESEVCR